MSLADVWYLVLALVAGVGLAVMQRRLRDVREVLDEMPGSRPPAIAAADEFQPCGSGHPAALVEKLAPFGVFPCERCGGSGRLRRAGKEYECSACSRTGWTTHGKRVGAWAATHARCAHLSKCSCCRTPWAWVKSASIWPAYPPELTGRSWTFPDGSRVGYGGGGTSGGLCQPCWDALDPIDRLAFLRVLWRANRMADEIDLEHGGISQNHGDLAYAQECIALADAEWPYEMRAVLFGESRDFTEDWRSYG